MSDAKYNNGGPAFPVRTGLSRHPVMGHVFEGTDGMSLLDYFAAHAPADPWPQFKPAMPPRPELTPPHKDGSGEWVGEYRDCDCDVCQAHAASAEARNAWDRENEKQRLIQWPYAWATAQLAERERRRG
jgi:hypothetical protein